LPAPEGPNKMVMPGGNEMERSRAKSFPSRLRSCKDTPSRSVGTDLETAAVVSVDPMNNGSVKIDTAKDTRYHEGEPAALGLPW
jgi:hypothetical protein